MNPPIYGFAHVAKVNDWKTVFDEQLEALRASGLYDKLQRLFVGVLGQDANIGPLEDRKIDIVYRGNRLEEYEFPTLQNLRKFCDANTCKVLYFHAKGVVCHPGHANIRDWRRYLEYFVIEQHERCLDELETADVCGVDWKPQPWPHFSGNFWWANASYIRTLPYPTTLNRQDRHVCEAWIGTNSEVKAACLHHSHHDFYNSGLSRSAYATS